VFTLDRIGRRWTLYWGAVGQGICCFCTGGLSYAAKHATGSYKDHVGGAAVFFVYLYTAVFGATWLTVPWLYPAEVSLSEFSRGSLLTVIRFFRFKSELKAMLGVLLDGRLATGGV
jgi:hypothetical protein